MSHRNNRNERNAYGLGYNGVASFLWFPCFLCDKDNSPFYMRCDSRSATTNVLPPM